MSVWAFLEMHRLNLAEKTLDGKRSWCRPTNRLYQILGPRDGVSVPRATPVNERTIQHENTILHLAQEGKAIGIPVACGNRSTQDMGSAGGGIAPDIMFRVESSPAGST